ncbi:flagellar biosynthesis anti-sigma factor FlgM [Aromatoleum buckelii]|uniref:Negative regulator of flagellin synthesis n=1 Tax=Aromatoleum buckelii TaxID=200254 RepID=A0ABX1N2F4_9RHOO|nr:flagellar biosynthesis anti-sigma factor FlgM [Aromatoleum buckelii]MCK0510885.1 flagellar biosynthesis anti-sigma factor FlgM [Aromatoleum buckelii]
MKIEGTPKPAGSVPAAESRPRSQPVASKPISDGEKVQLSSLSSSLNKAEAAMASTPVVDRGRVNEIRQAISEGRFKVDANRIAEGLIDSVRQILDSRRES